MIYLTASQITSVDLGKYCILGDPCAHSVTISYSDGLLYRARMDGIDIARLLAVIPKTVPVYSKGSDDFEGYLVKPNPAYLEKQCDHKARAPIPFGKKLIEYSKYSWT